MENKNTPKLRFKEFTDEWQGKKLGDISDLITKGTTPTSVGFVFLREGINFIKAENISKNGFIDIESTPKISVECNESLKRSQLQQDDLLFSIAGTLGRTATVQKKDLPANTNQALAIVRLMKENNLGFIHLFLNLPVIKRRVYQILSIGAQPNLSLEQVGDFKISLPSRSEQQKIADFLGAVDEKIGKLEEKKKAFEKYKKGIMQAIFSQMIRFKKPDGSNYPDWEERKLGEIGATYNGLTGKSAEDFGDGSPYITYMQIFGGSSIDMTKCRRVKVGEKENQNKVRLGDIFFTTSSETPEEVGFSSALLIDCGDAFLNSFCFGYRLGHTAKYSPTYLNIFFRSFGFRKKVIRLAQGSTRFNLSKIEMMKIMIQIPVIEEQQKIAEYLTTLDNKISLLNKQLEQAKLFKKSLLQRMFV